MKFPKMNKQPKRVVGIPSLQGGVNFRDALNMCADNQLTDCVNMWFRDGVLKTRNGKVKTVDYLHSATPNNSSLSWTKRKDKHHLHEDVIKIVDGVTYKLVSYLTDFENYVETSITGDEYKRNNYSRLILFWVNKDGDAVYKGAGYGEKFYGEIINYFVTATSKGVYLFLQKSDSNEIYKYNENAEGFVKISKDEIYAPIVVTHCKTNAGISASADELIQLGGVMLEGYNLIGNSYRMIYSTVNKNLLTDDVKNHWMMYPLLHNAYDFIGNTITVKHTTSTGTYTHTLTIKQKTGDIEEKAQGDHLKIGMWGGGFICFFTEDATSVSEDSKRAKVQASDYIEDNLEITAPCPNSLENEKKVFSMTKSESFGGASEGLNGGTRLFLGGNIESVEKSLVVWSGLNNPLYFPENCCFYVGNSLSAVKGFGKQEDMLVILKENELYYTKYSQNNNITAENLINQSIVDYTASNVYFPLVQINATIGCLSADSVKLCRNRLVWLGQDKKVYTLTTANQYSERNVFCVSEMIERSLKNENNLKNSYALDFDGHYMLVTDGKTYLMDYNSYGYQYVYSYQKSEDANIKIPWYIWENITDEYSILFNVNDRLCGISYKYATEGSIIGGSASKLELFTFTDDTDEGQPIVCMAQTKFFDFGNPNHRKNIEAVGISFGNNGGETINVQFVTEAGEECIPINLYSNEIDIRNAGYIKSRILYPSIRSAARFGVKFVCEGNMAIEGLNITYRTLGGAR